MMKPDDSRLQDIEFLISRLVDGDLDEASRRRVEQQISQSPILQAMHRDFEAIARASRQAGTTPESNWGAFESRVLVECRRVHREVYRRRVYRWVGGLSAAAAALVLFTTLMLRDGMEHQPGTMVAAIDVGPRNSGSAGASPSRFKTPASEFRFSRGAEPIGDGELEGEPPASGSLIVACATPWFGGTQGS